MVRLAPPIPGLAPALVDIAVGIIVLTIMGVSVVIIVLTTVPAIVGTVVCA
ncbi:MAG TPA: hypothetical protein VGJ97_05885 [Anaerolineaceae bacterium]